MERGRGVPLLRVRWFEDLAMVSMVAFGGLALDEEDAFWHEEEWVFFDLRIACLRCRTDGFCDNMAARAFDEKGYGFGDGY